MSNVRTGSIEAAEAQIRCFPYTWNCVYVEYHRVHTITKGRYRFIVFDDGTSETWYASGGLQGRVKYEDLPSTVRRIGHGQRDKPATV